MSEKKTIGMVLSGSGVFDGSEIHEAVICLLAQDRAGAVRLAGVLPAVAAPGAAAAGMQTRAKCGEADHPGGRRSLTRGSRCRRPRRIV